MKKQSLNYYDCLPITDTDYVYYYIHDGWFQYHPIHDRSTCDYSYTLWILMLLEECNQHEEST
jgi:hypothetical protein